MQIRDLKAKSAKELKDLVVFQRELVRDLRFKASQRQLKNVRELREAKKLLAQVLTVLKKK